MSHLPDAPCFVPADILLPKDCDMTKWSVVACDQYTSQPDYWKRIHRSLGDAPSTLRLMLPEAFLSDGKTSLHDLEIAQAMQRYLDAGVFRTIPHALIYVERWLSNGKLRRGLVGAVDLEQYDYTAGSQTLIRATEGTVLSRIPPRVAVRRHAPIELPHILMLMDDPERQIIEHLTAETDDMEQLYDFDLMADGGHITGYLLTPSQQEEVLAMIDGLRDEEAFARRYDAAGLPQLLFAVGDGNHSLASAKALYEEEKLAAPEGTELLSRYALVELENLHEDALEFEAIHRVVFHIDPKQLLADLMAFYPGAHYGAGEGHSFQYVAAGERGIITVPNPKAQLAVGTLQTFLDGWLRAHLGSSIDYVHGADVAEGLGAEPGNIAFLLPAMGKDQLFKTVIHDGALPRKTFSMGEAQDKRFYLEARRIK